MWRRFVPDIVQESVDVPQLVARTEGYSPADIEFAARAASQRALETAVYADSPVQSQLGPTTADYLDAIRGTRTTVSEEVAAAFREDTRSLARV